MKSSGGHTVPFSWEYGDSEKTALKLLQTSPMDTSAEGGAPNADVHQLQLLLEMLEYLHLPLSTKIVVHFLTANEPRFSCGLTWQYKQLLVICLMARC